MTPSERNEMRQACRHFLGSKDFDYQETQHPIWTLMDMAAVVAFTHPAAVPGWNEATLRTALISEELRAESNDSVQSKAS